MRRLLLATVIASAVVVPVSIAGLSSSSSASSGVTCAKLVGSVSNTVTFSKCTPKNKADKTLSGSAGQLATGGTLTWEPSGLTATVSAPDTTSPGQGGCPKKWTEEDSTSSITGGTSTTGPTPYLQVGDVVSSQSCNKGSAIKLLKGTVAHL